MDRSSVILWFFERGLGKWFDSVIVSWSFKRVWFLYWVEKVEIRIIVIEVIGICRVEYRRGENSLEVSCEKFILGFF